MAILKYATKLKKMSPEEILFRAKQQARQRMEKMRWKMKGKSQNGSLFISDEIAKWNHDKYRFPARRTRFFGLAGNRDVLREAYKKRFPESCKKAIFNADKLLEHEFRFLGMDVKLPGPIQWNENPETGKSYPMQHYTMMDTFNTEEYGDVKYVWELNRHQFFIEVGKAYFLTQNEEYSEKIWQWLESFFEQVPYKIGINHTSVLEHAVRIYSWVWAYYFTQDSPVWTAERVQLFTRHLLLQGEMIEKNLSYFYSPYNHLIGELAALTFLGTVYGNSPKMGIWRDKYWRELERQIEKQLQTDGFTVEQASYYHHFTMGFYLMLAVLRKQNGLSVSENMWKYIEKSMEFPMNLTRPDGQLPMLGDIDSARSIYFYQPEPMWDLRPFQALAATAFNRGDMKHVAGEPAEEILWLMGTKGLSDFDKLATKKPEKASQAYRTSGYFIMRDGWEKNSNYLSFDCGDIAHGVFKDETPSAAHGHGDILSFELSIEGQPMIIDPGFHTYFGPLEWHRYFRSTRGHNAIEVDGAGQATHEGRIGWSQVSSSKFDYWTSMPELDFAGGAIDQFMTLPEKVQHRRYILFKKGKYFLVMDEISGNNSGKAHQIESSLHFAPGKLSYTGNRLSYNSRLAGLLSLPLGAEVNVSLGQDKPDEGWMCTGYGCKTPAPVMRITANKALPVYIGMLFPLKGLPAHGINLSHKEMDRGVTRYHVKYHGGEEVIYLNPLRRSFSVSGKKEVKTDALCVIDAKNSNQERECHFIKVNHLQIGAEDLTSMLTDKSIAGLKYTFQTDKPKIESWKLEI